MVWGVVLNAIKFGKEWVDETNETKGLVTLFIEELKENCRVIDMAVRDGLGLDDVTEGLQTKLYRKLQKRNFNFNKLQKAKIVISQNERYAVLMAWNGKTSAELIANIYDKINDIKSMYPRLKNSSKRRWSVRNKNIDLKLQLFQKHIARVS